MTPAPIARAIAVATTLAMNSLYTGRASLRRLWEVFHSPFGCQAARGTGAAPGEVWASAVEVAVANPSGVSPKRGMGRRSISIHTRGVSAAATRVNAASAASSRLRLDIEQLHGRQDERAPALDRLHAAVGRDLAERLVAELSEWDRRRLEAALSTEFANRITSLLAEERGETD